MRQIQNRFIFVWKDDVDVPFLIDNVQNLTHRSIVQRPQAEVAAELGITPGALRVALSRLRQKFRLALQAEVADTVASEEEVDTEVLQHKNRCQNLVKSWGVYGEWKTHLKSKKIGTQKVPERLAHCARLAKDQIVVVVVVKCCRARHVRTIK